VVQDGGASTLGITKTGAGTQIFSGPNTYTGPTTVNAGTLKAGVATVIPFGPVGTVPASGAFGINSAVTMANTAGAVLDITGFNTQIGSITGGGAAGGNVTLGAATLTTGGDNSSPAAYAGAISGTGQLRKIGTGTQILSGTNSYTGLTTIFRGTLSLSGGNAIVNPSLLTPTAGAVLIAPVTAGDNGTLNLASSETIGTLSDAGAVAGSTTTVALNGSTLTLGVAAVPQVVPGSGNTTFAGTITGIANGNLVKNSPDTTFTLSGANTYIGTTTVNGGILRAANAAALGTAAGITTVASGASLQVANGTAVGAEPLTINGTGLGGIGALTQDAGGTSSFAGPITLATNSTISSNGAGVFTLSGGINKAGVNLTLTGGGTINVTGSISGNTGAFNSDLLVTGVTSNLGAANTYLGPTFITSNNVGGGNGILNANVANALPTANGRTSVTMDATGTGGSTLGLGANQAIASLQSTDVTSKVVLGGNTLTVGFGTAPNVFGTANANFAGVISGNGGVTKDDTSTQILSGASTYTGTTTVNNGVLAVGSTKGLGNANLTLNGGLIRTNGGPLVVDIGGGNVQFNGGIYQAIVGGTLPGVNHDQLKTTGTFAAPGGTLALVQQNGYLLAPGDKVNLAVATGGVAGGSVNGTAIPNASITGLDVFSVTPLLVPTVNLYPTTVTLEAMQGLFAGINGQTFQGFKVNFTPNQYAVARALDSVSARNLFKTGVVKELNFLDTQPIATLPGNLDKIAPEELTSVFHLAVSLANVNTHNLERRMEDIRMSGNVGFSAPTGGGTRFSGGANGPVGRRSKEIAPPSDDHWGMFLTGTGEFTRIGSNFNAVGYNLTTGGITAGLDYKVNANFAVGLSLGYANTTADLANGGSLDVDGGRLGLYATYYDQNFHVDATVSGGLNSYKTRRVTPNNTVAAGSPDGSEINVSISAGYDFKFGALTVGPVASYQYTNMQLDGFTETGLFAPLTIASKSTDSQRTQLGVRATYDAHVGRVLIRPEMRLAWQHEFGSAGYALTSNFATIGGNAFTVAGTTVGRDSLLASAGFIVMWNDRFGTYVYYDGQFGGSNLESHNVSGGFRLQF
ncbi:MAG: autotransporter domain-containing protein, partial [Chthoniobacteraceae bacterium]